MPASITLTVAHLPTSTSFFLSALQPLNYVYRGRVGNTIGFGVVDSPPDFWIAQESPGVPAGAAHVAFPALSQKKVQEFFVAALKAGGKCHGEPLLRDPASGYYSAAVIDFDGNSIEAVHRPDLINDKAPGEAQPANIASVNKSPSTMSSKAAPSVASKATTAKTKSQAPTEVKSVAPSSASTAKPQSTAPKSPTQVSKSPTQVSKAPSAAPSAAPSKAPSVAPSAVPSAVPSQARSMAPSAVPPQQQAVALATAPNGEVITNVVAEARGYINVARELVNQARPALDSSNSAPNIHDKRTPSPQSHQPSDTIVGTLLGVAAGAALTYAYTKAKEGDKKEERPAGMSRTRTDPSLADERYLYYHEYARQSPYAIESPPSEYSQARSQRYITMNDAEAPSDYASTVRPRRRSSFNGSMAPSSALKSIKMLEAPPSSFKAPTSVSKSSSRRSSRRHSDEDLRSSARSHASSRRSSGIKSHAASRANSPHGSERTAVPARKSSGGSKAPSKAPSRATSRSRASKDHPLAPSRASTWTGSEAGDKASFFSSKSKQVPESVFSKLKERERTGGRSELTKSVVGKVEDISKLNLPDDEVAPSDSVSQVSSSGGSKKSRKSKR